MLHGIGGTQGEEVVIGQVVESLALFFDFWIFVSLKCPFGPPKSKFAKIANFRKFSEIFANFGQFSPFLVIWVCLLSILGRKMKIFDFVVKKLSFWVRALRARGPSGPPGPSGPLVQVHLLTHLSLRIS